MKITVELQTGATVSAVMPFEGADHVVVEGQACPVCESAPLKVSGRGRRNESHDTRAANGVCRNCLSDVGTIRVQVSTIFGVEEDERVLNGPWRVY